MFTSRGRASVALVNRLKVGFPILEMNALDYLMYLLPVASQPIFKMHVTFNKIIEDYEILIISFPGIISLEHFLRKQFQVLLKADIFIHHRISNLYPLENENLQNSFWPAAGENCGWHFDGQERQIVVDSFRLCLICFFFHS